MKTDIERTKEFLDSLGVSYSSEDTSVTFGNTIHGEEYDGFPECGKVDGYSGFYTRFVFDKDGKFLIVGAWE